MPEFLTAQIMRDIAQVTELYHRLVIVAGPPGSGKTTALKMVHERTAAPLINVNLELSRRMLDLTAQQRALQLPRLLAEIVNAAETDLVLLDNIEVLFDPALKQDPLRLLQGLARNKTLVVAWGCSQDDKYLTYATPDHPEYRRYPYQDIVVIQLDMQP